MGICSSAETKTVEQSKGIAQVKTKKKSSKAKFDEERPSHKFQTIASRYLCLIPEWTHAAFPPG